jgi:hypothetical protein
MICHKNKEKTNLHAKKVTCTENLEKGSGPFTADSIRKISINWQGINRKNQLAHETLTPEFVPG